MLLDSNMHQQSMLSAEIKTIIYTPVNPSFTSTVDPRYLDLAYLE